MKLPQLVKHATVKVHVHPLLSKFVVLISEIRF